MNISKDQLEEAILYFARIYGLEKNYQAILSMRTGLPKVVEMIIQEMFLQELKPSTDTSRCAPKTYESYKIILEYSKELREKGYVEFN